VTDQTAPVKPKTRARSPGQRKPTRLSKARLAEMIEEATVDAYGESEQATGWFTMFEEHLNLPFETQVLGATVTVTSIDLRDDDQNLRYLRPRSGTPGDLARGSSVAGTAAGRQRVDRGVPSVARETMSGMARCVLALRSPRSC
jgi:hypothetical protein